MTLDFILSGPDIDAYNAATDESSPPVIPQRPTTVGLPVPANVSVVPELLTDASGASTVVLAVSWDEPFYNGTPWAVNYIVQWRLTNAGAGTPGPWTQQSYTSPGATGSRVSVQTPVVQSGTSLDVQVASVGSGASLSNYSATVTVSTVLSSVAPAAPTWVSATGSSGAAALVATAPPSPNFHGIQFWRAAHGAAFSTATAIGSVVTGAPSSTISYTDHPSAGTYDYFAVSETSSSVGSTDAGPETATVT